MLALDVVLEEMAYTRHLPNGLGWLISELPTDLVAKYLMWEKGEEYVRWILGLEKLRIKASDRSELGSNRTVRCQIDAKMWCVQYINELL